MFTHSINKGYKMQNDFLMLSDIFLTLAVLVFVYLMLCNPNKVKKNQRILK